MESSKAVKRLSLAADPGSPEVSRLAAGREPRVPTSGEQPSAPPGGSGEQGGRARPLAVFFSYSHKDETLRDELAKHLSVLLRQGIIDAWHDRRIGAGAEWAGEIDKHLNSADIILLLVSANFLASDYCYDKEMMRAMQRHEDKSDPARVVPVILRPVEWRGAPFGKLQALPKDGKPIVGPDWHSHDEAFADVAKGIRRLAEELKKKRPPDHPR